MDSTFTDMTLSHYSFEPFELRACSYLQINLMKPNGLWLSVDGDDSWEDLCRNENFRIEYLKYKYIVKLKKDANIRHLIGYDDIVAFTQEFEYKYLSFTEIKWPKVAKQYDGIIIDPYVWKGRCAITLSWYYNWDCASGCIWNLDAIETFELEDNKK